MLYFLLNRIGRIFLRFHPSFRTIRRLAGWVRTLAERTPLTVAQALEIAQQLTDKKDLSDMDLAAWVVARTTVTSMLLSVRDPYPTPEDLGALYLAASVRNSTQNHRERELLHARFVEIWGEDELGAQIAQIMNEE